MSTRFENVAQRNAGPPAKTRSRLADKFDLAQPRALLTGAQAIVRLTLMQRARDHAAGLRTAGYVTGYRGSPLANIDAAFASASKETAVCEVMFHPAVNEELAATAIWGSQQAELRGEGLYDGVFAIWYGKGPGVDRAGDALRHANHAGTSPNGGVLALMGDDHTCESSTSAHQSEFAFIDAMIPILAPSNVQEILDFGLIGFAMSRFAGTWVGMKCVKDNAEGTGTVNARLDRLDIARPDNTEFAMPQGGLNIRLGDTPLSCEARLHAHKRDAILAFAARNGLNRIVWRGGKAPRIGIVTAGKSYPDTRQALDGIGIDEATAAELGISLLKIGMTWPLQADLIRSFARGLDLIIVVEEKRAIVEPQLKDILYDVPDRPRIVGKRDGNGETLFSHAGGLDPLDVTIALGRQLMHRLPDHGGLATRLREIGQRVANRPIDAEAMTRTAYFCAGCPHNTSTRVPEHARAYAGIGCHYMAQWMDRATDGFTQMGGEGANWIGEAPFSKRQHIYQNIGDGTFVHSGSLALRAAVGARANVTFKILYNDAVAMTGGQPLEGGMTVSQMAAACLAEGAKRVDVVSETPSRHRTRDLPAGVRVHERSAFDTVQRDLAKVEGVTVLIYDQVCAAEKRRRRRRSTLADTQQRVIINARVCEGCGDCGLASNCVAILPLETEFGRKRHIDQSACNKDMSCIDGFCPSFVTLHGAQPTSRSGIASQSNRPDLPTPPEPLPEPERPSLDRPYAILATGVGGTGVVTISAILGQAAHIAGQGFGAIDVTGIAQKGGAVACHMRIAQNPDDIHAVRVATEGADLVLGGDLVVVASNKVLETIAPGRTVVVTSTHAATPGDFTKSPDLEVPEVDLMTSIRGRVAEGPLTTFDAHDLSLRLFADSVYANMILLGAAYQRGAIPVAAPAIEEAIALNGAGVKANQLAFRYGRLAAYAPERLDRNLGAYTGPTGRKQSRAEPSNLEALIERRSADLVAYQNEALADRYQARVAAVREAERAIGHQALTLTEAVARNYYKILAHKDEWEVARLYTDGTFEAEVEAKFTSVHAMTFHLAPEILGPLARRNGKPRKVAVPGRLAGPLLKWMARNRHRRGTWADPFRFGAERRFAASLLKDYESDLTEIIERLTPQTRAIATELAALPEYIRGFGYVRRTHANACAEKRMELRQTLRNPATNVTATKIQST